MTPSERERRIEAAARAISDQFEQGYRGHWCAEWQKDGRCERCTEVAAAALDAADEAVPMVPKVEAGRAEAAARDFAEALLELVIYLREPHAKIGEACGVDACIVCLAEGTARNVLVRHPSFSGEEALA